MAAVIPLIYLLFLLFFLVAAAVIIYHIWNFSLTKGEAVMTLTVFLVGFSLILLVNLSLYLSLDWSGFSLIPNNLPPGI